jgi:hypothetical protein
MMTKLSTAVGTRPTAVVARSPVDAYVCSMALAVKGFDSDIHVDAVQQLLRRVYLS